MVAIHKHCFNKLQPIFDFLFNLISGWFSVAMRSVVCQLQCEAYGWFMQVIEYDFIGLDLRPCPLDINGFSSGDARIFPPPFPPYTYYAVDIYFFSSQQQLQQIALILINDSRDVVKSGSQAMGEGEEEEGEDHNKHPAFCWGIMKTVSHDVKSPGQMLPIIEQKKKMWMTTKYQFVAVGQAKKKQKLSPEYTPACVSKRSAQELFVLVQENECFKEKQNCICIVLDMKQRIWLEMSSKLVVSNNSKHTSFITPIRTLWPYSDIKLLFHVHDYTYQTRFNL